MLTRLPAELLVMILVLLSQSEAAKFISTCRRMRRLRRFYPWVMNEKQFMLAPQAAEILHLRPTCDFKSQDLLQKLELPAMLRRVKSLHIARWLDVRHLISDTSIQTIYYYGNNGSLPTAWPTTLRTLVLRDIVTTQVDGNLDNLRVFSCNNSRMRELPKMPRLRGLYARHTHLEQIPELPELLRMNISHTAVKVLPELFKLTHLDVSYTLVSVIPSGLINLEHLNISSSQVTEISAKHRQLRVLKALYTELRKIPSLPNLEVLYLRGSQVHFHASELPYLPRLRHLDLEGFTFDRFHNPGTPSKNTRVHLTTIAG